jgi:hypothetical protein
LLIRYQWPICSEVFQPSPSPFTLEYQYEQYSPQLGLHPECLPLQDDALLNPANATTDYQSASSYEDSAPEFTCVDSIGQVNFAPQLLHPSSASCFNAPAPQLPEFEEFAFPDLNELPEPAFESITDMFPINYDNSFLIDSLADPHCWMHGAMDSETMVPIFGHTEFVRPWEPQAQDLGSSYY